MVTEIDPRTVQPGEMDMARCRGPNRACRGVAHYQEKFEKADNRIPFLNQ